jgi:hypothetical protein
MFMSRNEKKKSMRLTAVNPNKPSTDAVFVILLCTFDLIINSYLLQVYVKL